MPATVTLDALTADPSLADQLSPEALAALASRCAAVGVILANAQAERLLANHNGPQSAVSGDRLLTIDQAAERLGCAKGWLYGASKTLPFAVRLGPGQLRFSAAGMDRYIKAKMVQNR